MRRSLPFLIIGAVLVVALGAAFLLFRYRMEPAPTPPSPAPTPASTTTPTSTPIRTPNASAAIDFPDFQLRPARRRALAHSWRSDRTCRAGRIWRLRMPALLHRLAGPGKIGER